MGHSQDFSGRLSRITLKRVTRRTVLPFQGDFSGHVMGNLELPEAEVAALLCGDGYQGHGDPAHCRGRRPRRLQPLCPTPRPGCPRQPSLHPVSCRTERWKQKEGLGRLQVREVRRTRPWQSVACCLCLGSVEWRVYRRPFTRSGVAPRLGNVSVLSTVRAGETSPWCSGRQVRPMHCRLDGLFNLGWVSGDAAPW